MIVARDLGRRYATGGSRVDALAGIDLDIAAGERVAIVGASGSGKTTLLNLIGGLDGPTSGTLRVDDRDLAGLSSDELAAYRSSHVGFVFQSFRLLPHLTLAENVALPAVLAGTTREAAEARAAALLGRVGLAAHARHRPADASAGEQQRTAIARALVNGPRLLLADEPTGNLDADSAAAVLALIAELHASEGLTLIVATHDPDVAARADRVIRLRAGHLVEAVPSA
ncbi:MAG TPA: ABC transporter ATP-binding protein [Candidatus Limnocylindria bacterium]|nr:ABC transporter ATP-binding protein [Candidatus Limnocylindria bacterium]